MHSSSLGRALWLPEDCQQTHTEPRPEHTEGGESTLAKSLPSGSSETRPPRLMSSRPSDQETASSCWSETLTLYSLWRTILLRVSLNLLQESGVWRIANTQTLVYSPGKSQKPGGPREWPIQRVLWKLKKRWSRHATDPTSNLAGPGQLRTAPMADTLLAGPSRYSAALGVARDYNSIPCPRDKMPFPAACCKQFINMLRKLWSYQSLSASAYDSTRESSFFLPTIRTHWKDISYLLPNEFIKVFK